MSDKNNGALLIAAAAVAIYLMTKNKTALAARAPGATATPSKNVNGDMWTRLLGTGWQNLLSSAANKGSANGQPFVMSDGYGGLFTSDGTPVTSGDPIADWMAKDTGLPALYGSTGDYTTGAWTTGANPLNGAEQFTNAGYDGYFSNSGTGLSSVLDMFGGAGG